MRKQWKRIMRKDKGKNMLKKKLICISMCIVLIGILMFPANNLQNVYAEEVVKEELILNSIADSWLRTCANMELWCNHGCIEVLDDSMKNIINTSIKEKAEKDLSNMTIKVEKDDMKKMIKKKEDVQKFEESMKVIETADNYEETKKAIDDVNTVLDDDSVDGVNIFNKIKEGIFFSIGYNFSLVAESYFNNAKSATSIQEKRINIIEGAKKANIACETALKAANNLYQKSDLTEEERQQEIMKDFTNLLGKASVEVSIVFTVLQFAYDLSQIVTEAVSKNKKLDKYLDGTISIEDDLNGFWSAIVNPYDIYKVNFENNNISMEAYNGYFAGNYNIVDVPKKMYTLAVTRIKGDFISEKSIKELTIPDTITQFDGWAIKNSDTLEKVNYNANTDKGSYGPIISDCPKLKEINFGKNVKMLPESFLTNCGIEEIKYPEGFENVGRIKDCNLLKTITIPETVTKLRGNAINNCKKLESINYNAVNAEDRYDPARSSYIISDCPELKKINFGNKVKTLPEQFIINCGIEEIKYPEGFENVGRIKDCNLLKTITIPETVTKLRGNAINNCKKLESINYNAVNAEDGYDPARSSYIISDCPELKEINFGNKVKALPEQFIINCGLISIVYPNNISKIGKIKNVDNLNSITINNAYAEIYDSMDTIPQNAVIRGYMSSTAEEYAKKYNRKFEQLYYTFSVNEPFDYIYDGREHKWKPEVVNDTGKLLEKDKDYTVAYDTLDLKNAGTIKVIIKGKGNYAGEKEINYHIKQRKVTLLSASDEKSYDGQPLTNGNIKESGDGFAEGEGAIYTVTGSQTEVGTSKNTFGYKLNANTNADNYAITTAEGTLTVTEKKHTHTYKEVITKATPSKNGSKITKCTECGDIQKKEVIAYPKKATCATEYVYDGKTKKPEVTVTDANGKKVSKSEYALSYTGNCKNVGTYTVKITFKNNYAGTLKKTFTVVPKGTNLKSVKSGKKQMAVQWSKQNIQTTGYQLQYAADKSFKKNLKAVTIKNNKVTSRKISKLVGKKKYYVKIRTYKKVAGKTYYSKWSTVKSVTTKK